MTERANQNTCVRSVTVTSFSPGLWPSTGHYCALYSPHLTSPPLPSLESYDGEVRALTTGRAEAWTLRVSERMASIEPPPWLPDGWIMTVKSRKDGKCDRYYTSPFSGRTFRSRPEVLRYLNTESGDALTPQSPTYHEHSSQQIVVQQGSSLWLPGGWILEIKTRKSGKKAGSKYKCYIDSKTGFRFYSKAEVCRYMNGKFTTTEKNSTDTNSSDNVLAQFECNMDGLPAGWIKEIKYRKNSSGLRKDPYYTDPISGYVFRSKLDVLRYLETGKISKHAFRPKKKRIEAMYSLKESPPPSEAKGLLQVGTAARRCLFVQPISSCNGALAAETAGFLGEKTVFRDSDAELPPCVRSSKLTVLPVAENMELTETRVEIFSKDQISQPCTAKEQMPDESSGELLVSATQNLSLEVVPHCGVLSELIDDKMVEMGNNHSPVIGSGSWHQESIGQLTSTTVRASTNRHLKKLAVRRSMRNNAKGGVIPGDKMLLDSSNDVKIELVKENLVSADPPEPLVLKLPELGEPSCEQVEMKVSEMANETSILGGCRASTKVENKKAILLPCRSSKRLAGIDAGPTVAIELSDRSLRKRVRRTSGIRSNLSKQKPDDMGRISYECAGNIEITQLTRQSIPPRKIENLSRNSTRSDKYVEAAEAGSVKQEPTLVSPFGDSWPDPCIEFAYRTLIGDIPVSVLEDTTIAEGYFHQETSSVNQSPVIPVDFGCRNGTGQAGVPANLDDANLTVVEVKQESLLKNKLQLCAQVRNAPRREG